MKLQQLNESMFNAAEEPKTVTEMKQSEIEAAVAQLVAPINAFLATIEDEEVRWSLAGDIALQIAEDHNLQMDIGGLTV